MPQTWGSYGPPALGLCSPRSTGQFVPSALSLPSCPPPTLILCLRAFRISGFGVLKKVGWSSEQDSPLSPSFSLFLHPSLPFFHPSILYQLQLIFTKLLLCVKSWRENFPLILSESFVRSPHPWEPASPCFLSSFPLLSCILPSHLGVFPVL